MNAFISTLGRRVLLGLAVSALVVTGFSPSAGAGKPGRQELLTITGNGAWTATSAGGQGELPVDVYMPKSSTPDSTTALVIMSADDGRFPTLGSCEPAYALVNVDGDRRTAMGIHARGEVCGEYPYEPGGPSLQRFTGRYTIIRGPKRVEGDDGFLEVVFADNGEANVFAIDT